MTAITLKGQTFSMNAGMSDTIFETSRTTVRQLRMDDFPGFLRLQADARVHRFTGSAVQDTAAARNTLNRCMASYGDMNADPWIWPIISNTDQSFLGTCGTIRTASGWELGYRFCPEFWRQGFASEVCDPLIDYILQGIGAACVFARVAVENIGSVRTLQKSQLHFITEYYNKEESCTDYLFASDPDYVHSGKPE